MADPLSLLRQYSMQRKQIIERDNNIIFGEFSWPKTVKTNYIIYGTTKEYYTLECLLYLLKNIHLQHPVYVRQAVNDDVPIVRRPDRKELLLYLRGETNSASSIDKSAPLEMPTQVKRTADDTLEGSHKKPRFDDAASQKLKDQLAMKYGQKPEGSSIGTGILKDLSEELTTNKIAEIKKKMLTHRRTRIKGDPGEDADRAMASFADMESDKTKEIRSRERQWRTRVTILQSNGKIFSKNVMAILNSVKAREEGRNTKPVEQHTLSTRPGITAPSQPQPRYDRYGQEHLQSVPTEGFNIDTTGSYAGQSLKSTLSRLPDINVKQAPLHAAQMNRQTPVVPAVKQMPPPAQKPTKKASRTPIIIIPSAPKSLISMLNAKEILEELKYVSTEERRAAGAKRENDVLIQRRKEGGLTVPYRIIDNPGRLTNADWERVVAVFVMGQAWQFKGWPFPGGPVEILSKIAGFHIKFTEINLEKNVENWAVTVIQLSRSKRHLDRAALLTFWEKLDKHMIKNKPHLRF